MSLEAERYLGVYRAEMSRHGWEGGQRQCERHYSAPPAKGRERCVPGGAAMGPTIAPPRPARTIIAPQRPSREMGRAGATSYGLR